MDTFVHPESCSFKTRPPVLTYSEEPNLSEQPDTSLQSSETVFEELPVPDDGHPVASTQPPSQSQWRTPPADWSVPFAVSLLCHGLALAAIAAFFALSASTGRLRVARGNPYAQEGSSDPGYALRDDTLAQKPPQKPSLATPPKPSPTDPVESAMDQSLGDSSSLRQRPDPLPIPEADAVIGVGNAGISQPLPHFGSPTRRAPAPNAKAAPSHPAGGEMAPPRVAGPRGQRDGFDSRGLPIPDYPYESQRRGEQGLVVVDVEVLLDGRVGAVTVAWDAGYPRLAAAAVEKVKLATFEPARINGKPVVGHIRIPYRFILQ